MVILFSNHLAFRTLIQNLEDKGSSTRQPIQQDNIQLVLCYEAGRGAHAAGKDWIRVLTAVRRSFVTMDIAGIDKKQGCHLVIFDAIVTTVISATVTSCA